ncbi:hypothetical protein ABZ682_22765 [Streptomyces griseoviridis]|uniref:hypothetical protein n=1 Tax=Streptomyces griseoviridis TaxID=45398 RepID=UPI0033E6148F
MVAEVSDEPRRLDRAEKYEIPEGASLTEVPRPRHDWGDVVHCPNDGCGQPFLATPTEPPSEAP